MKTANKIMINPKAAGITQGSPPQKIPKRASAKSPKLANMAIFNFRSIISLLLFTRALFPKVLWGCPLDHVGTLRVSLIQSYGVTWWRPPFQLLPLRPGQRQEHDSQ
jgi:hypothetical protein